MSRDDYGASETARKKSKKREGWHKKHPTQLEDKDYVEACRAKYKYRSYREHRGVHE